MLLKLFYDIGKSKHKYTTYLELYHNKRHASHRFPFLRTFFQNSIRCHGIFKLIRLLQWWGMKLKMNHVPFPILQHNFIIWFHF